MAVGCIWVVLLPTAAPLDDGHGGHPTALTYGWTQVTVQNRSWCTEVWVPYTCFSRQKTYFLFSVRNGGIVKLL